MKHRLFHTLVLSGAALVGGCASTANTPTAHPQGPSGHAALPPTGAEPPAPSAQAAEPAPGPAQSTPDAPAAAQRTDAPASPEELRAMVTDARACGDVAWPTTKSASAFPRERVSVNGRSYQCIARHVRRTPQCCAEAPAP